MIPDGWEVVSEDRYISSHGGERWRVVLTVLRQGAKEMYWYRSVRLGLALVLLVLAGPAWAQCDPRDRFRCVPAPLPQTPPDWQEPAPRPRVREMTIYPAPPTPGAGVWGPSYPQPRVICEQIGGSVVCK